MRLRDRIRACRPRRELVDVPEWSETGEAAYIRTLSGAERQQLEEWMAANRGPDKQVNGVLLSCKLLVLSLVTEDGSNVFDDSDIDWLKDHEASGPALVEVGQRALRLNRMTKGDHEELVGNSGAIQPASSGTASPNGSACPSAVA